MIVKFDGVDGSGKTSLRDAVAEYYSGRHRVLVTTEYGNDLDNTAVDIDSTTSVSEVLKKLATGKSYGVDHLERELIFSLMSRRTNRVVLPKQHQLYDIILVDRSSLSLFAYGFVPGEDIKSLHKMIVSEVDLYDLIFWIETPASICAQRLSARNAVKRELDAVEELESEDYLLEVCERFKILSSVFPRVQRLDGTLEKSELVRQVIQEVDSRLNSNA